EKELTGLRDEVSRHRRELPWVKVEKEYVFDGPDGKETLADLFEDRSQLIVYHFMFAPGWEEGCKSCSYLADHFDGANWHLPHRDVTFVVISRAPLTELDAYKKRMGWRFKWLSSYGNDFNFDYHVSATEDEKAKGKMSYNYRTDELIGGAIEYWLVTTGDDNEPGINGGSTRPREGQSPGTLNTIAVRSLDQTIKKIEQRGGKICVPKMAIPNVGCLAYAEDPAGNVFGIIEPDTNAK